jgi:subtilisin family serine protease
VVALAISALVFGATERQPAQPSDTVPGFVAPVQAQSTIRRRRVIKTPTQKKRLKRLRKRTTTSTPTQPKPTATPQKKKRVVKPTKPKVAQPKVSPPALNPRTPRDEVAGSDLLPPHVRAYLRQTPTRQFAPVPDMASRFRQGQVLVSFDDRTAQTVLDDLAQRHGLTYVDGLFVELLDADVHRFAFDPSRSVADVIVALEADGRTARVQSNYVFGIQGNAETTPSDEAQAALQYALAKLRVTAAHKKATGKTVRIAVIDTQVDVGHPELNGAVLEAFDAVPGGGVSADPHGTAITGIIAARKTLRGVAPEAEVLAVRAFVPGANGLGEADTISLLRGIDWAERQGARVFNMSFAGPKDALLLELIDAAHDSGIILVAASGNAGPQAPPLYPAAHEHVIAVTATDYTDKLYRYANQGAHITLAAPGVDILVVVPDGRFGMMSGTSLATAHISGLVALLLEGNPDLTPRQIQALITQSAHDLGPKGADTQFGAGRADAMDALEQGSRAEQVSQQ